MTRRGDKISAFDALQGLAQLSELTAAPATSEPAGGVQALAIAQLLPDPVQARRVLPAVLRGRFLAGELGPVEALRAWSDLAAQDATEAEVLESRVVRLARSLQAQQQINPVTVHLVRVGEHDRYMIETGERRWWAHWWLVGIEQEGAFETIQAVVVEKVSPWRQAAENLQGEPLSAVQEACQVARLVLLAADIEPDFSLHWTGDRAVVELTRAEMGYDFYRQALDRRVPQGAWPSIEGATGKGARYCQYLLRLLRLSDLVLELADRAGLSESQLRPLAAGESDPARQLRIAQLIAQFELGRDQVTGLVGTADLDAAERKLSGEQEPARKPPAIRPPERIVLDRLEAMTRLLDRTSRSEPEMVQVLSRTLRQLDDGEQRREAMVELHTFLGQVLASLEQPETNHGS